METKVCNRCRTKKPLDDFHFSQVNRDGHQGHCRDCEKKSAYDQKLKREYGITTAQYEMILKSQGNVCAICGQPKTAKQHGKIRALSVDHDHATQRVRGLLCNKCNLGIGNFRDNPGLLANAIKYLEKNT